MMLYYLLQMLNKFFLIFHRKFVLDYPRLKYNIYPIIFTFQKNKVLQQDNPARALYFDYKTNIAFFSITTGNSSSPSSTVFSSIIVFLSSITLVSLQPFLI